ncbi:MAG: alkane 1-monooxygenase, partial [Deltaproteobacteria bacterium]|nr:alkane 1-monooxygenase [Deltaproteobacteria bacterium]
MNRAAFAKAGPAATPVLGAGRTFALHLWAFVLPITNLVFLLTGPHSAWAALLWTAPIWILVLIDYRAAPDHRQPPEQMPAWPFDLQVYLLIVLQLTNHVMVCVMASQLELGSLSAAGTAFANLVAMSIVSGTTAGYSGIVLAHELVHRRNPVEFLLGRLLLACTLNEQFATEHIRGHHPRLGTGDDPATARYGESLRDFIRRTIPEQFRSAWHLEKVRLGDANMTLGDPRMVRHRVLQGVVGEIALLVAVAWVFGWVALVFFVMQARSAVVLLETVNYIEHWGITRASRTVTPFDSWDTDNGFTLRTLVGLSRHADHHAQASRPYQRLRYFEQSPKMPHGYYGTILMALFRNEAYQAYATAELERRGLGPFRAGAAAAV